VLQLALFALAGWSFTYALVKNQLRYWVYLGFIFALGCYAKYSMVLLALPFGLFLMGEPNARHHLRRAGPYVAGLLCIILLLPHLKWLKAHEFLPFLYMQERLEHANGLSDQMWHLLRFLSAQCANILPTSVAALVLLYPFQPRKIIHDPTIVFNKRLMYLLAFGPLLSLLAFSLLHKTYLHSMYGMPCLTFIPLAWIAKCQPNTLRSRRFFLCMDFHFYDFIGRIYNWSMGISND
jgi:4-amino-4-deoxy-L-arabinose transferase-like glycosyltransferase